MKTERIGTVAGTMGTVVSCSAMMFAVFPALLGIVGASASTSMGMMGTEALSLPGWVPWVTRYSAEILAISMLLMGWGVWRASRLAQALVGLGMVLLIANQVSMTPTLFLPALGFVIAGNVVAWRQTRSA